MKLRTIAILLFLLQVFLVFSGVTFFGKYLNPVLLLVVSCAIPFFYFKLFGTKENVAVAAPLPAKVFNNPAGALWATLFMLLCGILFYRSLLLFPDPSMFSDVLPQLDALYDRFAAGEQPYAPVNMTSYSPFPVYMPLHWLPIGITRLLHIDTRWIGYLLLLVATAFWGFSLDRSTSKARLLPAAALPAFVLFAHLRWGYTDVPVSLETVVAAYYVILAVSILSGNICLITGGLILCLLSRYTLVFWLPVFAVLMLQVFGLKKNMLLWAAAALAVIGFYMIPFLSRDTSILLQGIQYHNHAAVMEWVGYGIPPVSNTFETGLYLAPFFKDWFPGTMEQRVFYTRIIQGSLMILINLLGIWYYQKHKATTRPFEFLFVMLYLVLACFYFAGPLTYRYYLITLLLFSAMMTARVLVEDIPSLRLQCKLNAGDTERRR